MSPDGSRIEGKRLPASGVSGAGISCPRQPIARHVTNRPRGWEPGPRGAGGASNATPGAATTLAIGIGYRHVSAEGALPLEVW